jgi:uncharacterized protein
VILVDSGVFVAAAFPNDRHHEPCRRFLAETSEDLAISVVIVAEVSHLLRRAATRPRPELAFLMLIAAGRIQSLAPAPEDYRRMAELVEQYHDLPLGAADASIVAIAERLGVSRLATVDRKDFTAVRPRHVAAFELLPDLTW